VACCRRDHHIEGKRDRLFKRVTRFRERRATQKQVSTKLLWYKIEDQDPATFSPLSGMALVLVEVGRKRARGSPTSSHAN